MHDIPPFVCFHLNIMVYTLSGKEAGCYATAAAAAAGGRSEGKEGQAGSNQGEVRKPGVPTQKYADHRCAHT